MTSNVMVVNKDGDLELYAIHDTPKQLAWSARGDLALGGGLGLKILEGYKEGENDDGEAEFLPEEHRQGRSTSSRGRETSRTHVNVRAGASRSLSASRRPSSITRGRGRQGASEKDSDVTAVFSLPPIPTTPSPVPTSASLGNDEDGVSTPEPKTSSVSDPSTASTATLSKATGLTTTRPKEPKRSHAKVGNYDDRCEVRSPSRTDSPPADDLDGDSSKHDRKLVSTAIGPSHGNGVHSISTLQPKETARKTKGTGVVGLIREDISMIIRRRVKAGYGLSQVR